MALIQCPNCGETISDRASKCVHCGYDFLVEQKIICEECGTELEPNASICPKCGCPVTKPMAQKAVIEPQPVEVTGVKVTGKGKKWIIGIAAAALVIAAAVFAITTMQQNTRKKEYAENLKLATLEMLDGAAEAETSGNLIKQVWYNAIYEERDDDTDKYTRPDGYFVSDFNDALSNLFSDQDFVSQISEIQDNQTEVQSLMKDLQNPPSEYENAYNALSDYYDAYRNLTNIVVNPSGSLTTFSSNFNDADTEAYNCYTAMQLYFE